MRLSNFAVVLSSLVRFCYGDPRVLSNAPIPAFNQTVENPIANQIEYIVYCTNNIDLNRQVNRYLENPKSSQTSKYYPSIRETLGYWVVKFESSQLTQFQREFPAVSQSKIKAPCLIVELLSCILSSMMLLSSSKLS